VEEKAREKPHLEDENETKSDGLEVEHGVPVLAENVQTDISLQVDVWVVDFRLALWCGWRERCGQDNMP
jgi:hypothetical protein